jgi:hypothetical protein
MLFFSKYLWVIKCLNPYKSTTVSLFESKTIKHCTKILQHQYCILDCVHPISNGSQLPQTSVGLDFKADCVFLFLATAPTVKQLALALAEWLVVTRSALCPSMLRSKSARSRSDNCHRVWCGAEDHMLEAALVMFYLELPYQFGGTTVRVSAEVWGPNRMNPCKRMQKGIRHSPPLITTMWYTSCCRVFLIWRPREVSAKVHLTFIVHLTCLQSSLKSTQQAASATERLQTWADINA